MRRPLSIAISISVLLAASAPIAAQSTSAGKSNSRSTSSRVIEESVRTQTADQQVLQALNRLGFGPRPGDVAQVRRMGVDAWIDEQLHPERIDDAAMDRAMAAYPLLDQDQSKLAADYAAAQRERRQVKRADASDSASAMNAAAAKPAIPPELREAQRTRQQLGAELASARVARAVASNRQLLEVMTDFWENHFSVYARKNAVEPYYLADYDRTIRAHALGRFRDLLGAVAHSPAMLVYLDNALSRANPGEPTLAPANGGALARFGPNGPTEADVDAVIARRRLDPMQAMRLRQRFAQFQENRKKQGAKKSGGLNENYGRELMELHTLGVDGGYTQQDVIEVARALTGWSVRPPAQGGGFIFRPEWHDAGDKTILGQHFPAGHAEDEGERVLDMVARSPATAHHIALELCQRFVSDSPSTALVNRAAQTFLRTDGDIREVVRTIVTSPEFFSAQAYRAKVKSPFEVVVSAARALGAQPDTTARTAFAVSYLGEPLFGHEEPNGWPETGESWMNTGGILNRINFGMAVAADRLPGATIMGVPGADTLQRAPRVEQVDGVVAALLGGAVSPDTRKILESGEHPLAAAARESATAMTTDSADDASMSAPMLRTKAKGTNKQGGLLGAKRAGQNAIVGAVPQLDGFAQVVGLALGSPEFQRR